MENGLQIYFQTESGFDFDSNNSIEFPGQSIGWDLSTQHGATGSTAIIALIDGKEILAWSVEDQKLLAPQTINAAPQAGFCNAAGQNFCAACPIS